MEQSLREQFVVVAIFSLSSAKNGAKASNWLKAGG